MKKFLMAFLVSVAVVAGGVVFFGRAPDFSLKWSREVPSKETPETLAAAFHDPRTWPIFHHALKSVTLYENGQAVAADRPAAPGMTAVFVIEPKKKEWKRFDIRAEVLPPKPGESLRFRMLDESSGKTTRLVADFEWWIGVRPANEMEAKRGNRTVVFGGATAETKTSRARFLGRLAPKILMNQLYQVDLVRLANFTENQKAWGQEVTSPYE
jgi:hypothetical protein